MIYDLQKASLLKRLSAYILDMILLSVVAVGFGWLLSMTLGFDAHSAALEEAYSKYETAYGVRFDITQEEYLALTQEEKDNYENAYQALIADEKALYEYNAVISQSLLIVSLGLFLGYLALEFFVPMALGNGQTLGKKVFAIAVMRVDGVKLSNPALFVRTVLGKYTVETMFPVLVSMMIFFGQIGILGTALVAVLGLVQLALLVFNKNRSLIHDLMAGTVTVDMASQMIFKTPQDLIDYKKQLHAQQAQKKTY